MAQQAKIEDSNIANYGSSVCIICFFEGLLRVMVVMANGSIGICLGYCLVAFMGGVGHVFFLSFQFSLSYFLSWC